MDLASIVGQTEVTIRVNGILIECMEKGNSNGPMVDNMKGIGETTWYSAKGDILGLMVGDIRDSIVSIKSMARVFIIGKMVENSKEYGIMANVLVSANTF